MVGFWDTKALRYVNDTLKTMCEERLVHAASVQGSARVFQSDVLLMDKFNLLGWMKPHIITKKNHVPKMEIPTGFPMHVPLKQTQVHRHQDQQVHGALKGDFSTTPGPWPFQKYHGYPYWTFQRKGVKWLLKGVNSTFFRV